MSSTMSKEATVTLTPVNFPDEPYPRVLHLTPSEPLVKIGRASKSVSKNLHPSAHNAWFDSPVMSREHAQITIALDSKNIHSVKLTDVGSMHGTKIDGRFLKKNEIQEITSGQLLTFGNEVARGPGSCHTASNQLLGYGQIKWLPIWANPGCDVEITNNMIRSETFPPRQFRVYIEWSDWSPPTPADSSPRANNSPIRGYGITDEELLLSSDDGLSDNDEQSDHMPLESPEFSPKSPKPSAAVSTFVVPDSDPSSPVNSDYEPPEEIQSRNEIEMITDSQEDVQVAHSQVVTCQAELVGIEFSGPVGLTEKERAEDEGHFLPGERAWSPPSPVASQPSEDRQAMGLMCLDINEKPGNARNPVLIDDSSVNSDDDEDSHSMSRSEPAAEDDGYSPPLEDSSNRSTQYQIGPDDVCAYSCDSEEHGSEANAEDEIASDDGLDNEGWPLGASHQTSEEEDSEPEYDEESEAEDVDSDNELDEELSQPDLEPSKVAVMEQALEKSKAPRIAKSPPPALPPTKPVVGVECHPLESLARVVPRSSLAIKEPTITTTIQNLPPIQKIRTSEPVAPYVPLNHLRNSYSSNSSPTARAPSPSDAAMVKSSACPQPPKHTADTLPNDRYSHVPVAPSVAITMDAQDLMSNQSTAFTARRDGPFNSYNCTLIASPESLRAANARKLGEISGKHEYFKAREANREIFPEPPRSSANKTDNNQNHPDAVQFELDPHDINSYKSPSEHRDFASTASEAGSFGELFTFAVDDIHQGERMPAASSAASAARFNQGRGNMMGNDADQYDHSSFNVTAVDLDKPRGHQELRSSSRVAIRNIVDPMDKETPLGTENTLDSGSSRLGMKRKADEISSLDSEDQHESVAPQTQQQQHALPDAYTLPESPVSGAQPQEINTFASHEALISFDASSQETQAAGHQVVHPEEPLRKKFKFAREPKVHGFVKLAAATLTGVVVGSIGMFAALAASAPSA